MCLAQTEGGNGAARGVWDAWLGAGWVEGSACWRAQHV